MSKTKIMIIKVCACGAAKDAHENGGACGAFQYCGAASFAAKVGK